MHGPVDCCRVLHFRPLWANLRWDFQELDGLRKTVSQFKPLCGSSFFVCVSFLMLSSLDRILNMGDINERSHCQTDITWSLIMRQRTSEQKQKNKKQRGKKRKSKVSCVCQWLKPLFQSVYKWYLVLFFWQRILIIQTHGIAKDNETSAGSLFSRLCCCWMLHL